LLLFLCDLLKTNYYRSDFYNSLLFNKYGKVLYVSREESKEQIKMRGDRA